MLFQKHSFHGDVQTIWILLSSVHILGGSSLHILLGVGLLVSAAAPRYSSLEADEFDEGSAAEEADASVTQ